jgi:hypothetical protein
MSNEYLIRSEVPVLLIRLDALDLIINLDMIYRFSVYRDL